MGEMVADAVLGAKIPPTEMKHAFVGPSAGQLDSEVASLQSILPSKPLMLQAVQRQQ
jgi:hypothetical protein